MVGLAYTLLQEGRLVEAEKLTREDLGIQRRVLGSENPDTLNARDVLADILAKEGHFVEAEKLQRETVDAARRVFGPENPGTASFTYNLASIAALKGDHTEALSLLRQALDHGMTQRNALNMEKDSDLKSLHGDPGFDVLLADAKQRGAAAQKPK